MKFFLFSFLIFCLSFANAQLSDSESVWSSLKESEAMHDKGVLFSTLSNHYLDSDVDSAIFYSRKGYDFEKGQNNNAAMAEFASNMGYCYIKKNNLDSARINYTKAKELFSASDSLFKYTQNTMRLGNISLAQDNPIDALKTYQECIEISERQNYVSLIPHLYNNIGLVYKEIEDYDDAESNFQNAYTLFLENDDEANSLYPLFNIALVQSIIGKDDEAINGYLNLVTYHLKTENWVSLAQIYNSISEIYLKNKNYSQSQEYLEMALSSIKNKSDSFNTGPTTIHEASIYTNAAELYYILNETQLAIEYAYKAILLSEQNSYKINLFKGSKILAEIYDKANQLDSALYYYKGYIDYSSQYQDEYDIKQLTILKMQNEFDEILKQNEIDRIYQEAAYKNRELKFIGVAVFAGLLAIILVLLYLYQKNKNVQLKLKEENLELEKKKLNQSLDYKKKELASNMMYLMEKNEFITSISKKLIELKPDAKKNNKDLIQQIINEIKLNSTTKIWEEFEVRFMEVHEDFYNALHATHPNLTLNEVKICSFLRLNMSTKEISAVTHQSVKSINMARFRLRKKLDIEREENLISYLNSL